jgi:hypothetical protein
VPTAQSAANTAEAAKLRAIIEQEAKLHKTIVSLIESEKLPLGDAARIDIQQVGSAKSRNTRCFAGNRPRLFADLSASAGDACGNERMARTRRNNFAACANGNLLTMKAAIDAG